MGSLKREAGRILLKKMFAKKYASLYEDRDKLTPEQKQAIYQAVKSFRAGEYYSAWRLISGVTINKSKEAEGEE